MNKLIAMMAAAACAGVASVASSGQANAGEVLDRVIATKTLTVAVGTDWGPISHLDENHELVGFDVEIAKQIAKFLGVEAKFVTPSWDIIAAGRWEGRWDIGMGQMVPDKAGAEKFDFPAVYIYGWAVAVVHKDSKAAKLSDLDGKVIGVAPNSQSESYANQTLTPDWAGAKPIQYHFKPSEVKTYESDNVAFEDLRLGDGVRLDGVVADNTMARDAIKSGYPLKVLGSLFSYPGAIATLHGDKEFDDKIAAAIQGMRDDGTLSQLAMKWYGVDRTVEK